MAGGLVIHSQQTQEGKQWSSLSAGGAKRKNPRAMLAPLLVRRILPKRTVHVMTYDVQHFLKACDALCCELTDVSQNTLQSAGTLFVHET